MLTQRLGKLAAGALSYHIRNRWFDVFKRQLFVAVCALFFAFGCCPDRGERTYFFSLSGDLISGVRGGGDAITWGGRSDGWVVSADQAVVRFSFVNATLRDEELLEFYDGDGPVDLRGVILRGVNGMTEDCPHDEVEYDLTVLPAGEYTMLHRRSSAPDGFEPYYGDVTWMTCEGEDALVTTIVRRP